jgi:imidazolonepropionase-like amidohydrolase
MRKSLLLPILIFIVCIGQAQTSYLLTASRVFDGEKMHEGWGVLVKGTKITAVGPLLGMDIPIGTVKVNYPNATITPGLIEGHSHLLLYPYNITDWDTQVLKETDNYRTARATVHAKNTLMAGFTTARDLGTEGAGYADVALKRAINENIIPGPRLLVAGRAIVSTGSYGPKGYDHDQQIMLGAEPADGDDLIRVIRDQIGKGADFVKIYADYRWGINGEDQPSFTLDELKVANDVITSSGRMMVCHAKSKEAIRRAVLAGAKTIEHGDFIDTSLGRLMKDHGVTYIPTISAVDVISQYRGWKKGIDPAPANVINKRNSFKEALASGVAIGMGGDVGVYPHGENALEMELMVEYGMKPFDVLHAATAVNAKAFRLDDRLGFLKPGMLADVSIFEGNPAEKISDVRKVLFVMKEGAVVRKN